MTENQEKYNFRLKTKLKRLRKLQRIENAEAALKKKIETDAKTKIDTNAKTKIETDTKTKIKTESQSETGNDTNRETETPAKRITKPRWFQIVQIQPHPRLREIQAPEIHLNGKVHLPVRDRIIRTHGWMEFEMLLLLKLNQCLLFHVPVTNRFVMRMGEVIAKFLRIKNFKPTRYWVSRMRKKVPNLSENIINFELDDEKVWKNTLPPDGRVPMSQYDMFEAIKRELRAKRIGKYAILKPKDEDEENSKNKKIPIISKVTKIPVISKVPKFANTANVSKISKNSKISNVSNNQKLANLPIKRRRRRKHKRCVNYHQIAPTKQYINRKRNDADMTVKSDDLTIDSSNIVMDIKVEPETLQEVLPPVEAEAEQPTASSSIYLPEVPAEGKQPTASSSIDLPEQVHNPDINLPEPDFTLPLESESADCLGGWTNITFDKSSLEKQERNSRPLNLISERYSAKKRLELIRKQQEGLPSPSKSPPLGDINEKRPYRSKLKLLRLQRKDIQASSTPQKAKKPKFQQTSNKTIARTKNDSSASKAKVPPGPRPTGLYNSFGSQVDNLSKALNGTAVEKKTTITNDQGETFEITIFEDSFDPSIKCETSDEMYSTPIDMDLQYPSSATSNSYSVRDSNSLTAILGVPVFIKSENPCDMEPSELDVPAKDMLLGL